jgi:AraC family transcriptional regulator of adaptative response / DNA-3-methyladenine glycosylase II
VLSVRLARDARALELVVPDEAGPDLIGVVETVARLFDLHADPLPIWSHLRRDPMLRASLGSTRGVRVPGAFDRFEMVVRAVLGQQISVTGARTIAGRVANHYGVKLDAASGGGITHVFPTPDRLATAELESVGLTRARADCLRAVARRIADGSLSLDASRGLDAWVEEFSELPGIGPWTAHYVAMRALGEPDAFPASDLGVRRALAGGHRLPSAQQATLRAEAWRPWRAYAVMALWRRHSDLDSNLKKKRD